MQTLPHDYVVTAVSSPQRDTYLSADRLPVLQSAAPAEFGGPGNPQREGQASGVRSLKSPGLPAR